MLPGGSTLSGQAPLSIPDSDLSFGTPVSKQYVIGDTVSIPLDNRGGKDTLSDYVIDLYDGNNTKISNVNGASAVNAGMTALLKVPVPEGIASGRYVLKCSAYDPNTDKTVYGFKQIEVRGVELNLSVSTSKEWYLSTETVQGTTSITLNSGGLVNAALNLKVLAAAPGQLKWWDKSWKHRQPISITSGNYERENYPVSVNINFTDEFTKFGKTESFDENSLRVIEYDANGEILREIPCQFEKSADYNAINNATGKIYWIMDGTTPVGGSRRYVLYFDSLENGPKIPANYETVTATLDNTNKFFKTSGVYVKWGGYGYSTYSDEIITDFRFDDNGNGDPRDDFDRLQDTDDWYPVVYGFLGNGFVYGFGGTVGTIVKQGPVFVEINIGKARFRYYKNNKQWLETNEIVSYLYNFSSIYDYVKAGNKAEKYLIDNTTGWETTAYYGSWVDPGYLAFRSSKKGIIFGAVDNDASYHQSANKLSSGYTRTLSYYYNSPTADSKIYWYSDTTGNYQKIGKFSDSILNKPGLSVLASEVLSEDVTTPVVWEKTIAANVTQSTAIQTEINLLSKIPGKYFLQSSLISAYQQLVAQDTHPFYVVTGNTLLTLNTDKEIYRTNESVTITGEARNLAAVDMINATLLLKSNPLGKVEKTIYSATFSLPAGGALPFSVTVPAETAGSVNLSCIVTQGSNVLASVTGHYQVAVPEVTATLNTPDSIGDDPFTIALELKNRSVIDAVTNVLITDDNGQLVAQEPVAILAGELRRLEYTRQIRKAPTYTAVLSGDLNLTLAKAVAYVAANHAVNINSKIVTDKITYNPNEQVSLTATTTANAIMENVTAWITVTDQQGLSLYSSSTAITTLIQGQMTTFKKYWNTGANPAGSYVVTLQVLDLAGTVVANSTCNLSINSTTKPTALLKGQISLDKQNILTGEPVTVSYSVTNAGNVDLSDIALSVQTINMAEADRVQHDHRPGDPRHGRHLHEQRPDRHPGLQRQGLPGRPPGEYCRSGRDPRRHLLPGGRRAFRTGAFRAGERRRCGDLHPGAFGQQRRRSQRRQAHV